MKKFGCLGVVAILAVVGIALAIWVNNWRNDTIVKEESIGIAWSKVESAYQRRADLIPNIVNTAKGYADFENKTLTDVIEARAKATSITIDPSNISEEQLAKFQEVQQGLAGALKSLLAVSEAYPDLKANENFKELINELERTENQINVERNKFNDTVGIYNKHIKVFPGSALASFFGFEPAGYFKADAGSENAPDVEFDFE